MTRAKKINVNQKRDDHELHIIHNFHPMNDNIRIVPIQQLCVLCGDELKAHDVSQGLAGWLCQACIRLLGEQVVLRELEQRTKIVRVH